MKNLMVLTQVFRGLFARLAVIVFLTTAPFHVALAQVAPSLGTAQSFAVLGASTVTNTGPTIIIGDLGVSPGSAVTGFPPGIVVGGTIHAADAVALQAQSDTTTAYNDLAAQACDTVLTGQDLGGMTLVSGVYCFSSSAQLTGTLTLDAQGNPNAVWVFQMGSTLITASNSSVLVINGGQTCNVFWQVGSSATIGTNTTFIGDILALASVTLTTDATLSGRALAQNGAVTMDTNTVAITACAVPPVTPIPPTLNKAFSPATIDAGGISTLTITLSNPDTTAAILTAPLTDTLPSGVVVAPTPNASTTCGGAVTAAASGSTVTLASGTIPANGSCTVTVDVTAPVGDNYINTLAAGALQTSNGNNAAPAVATLTVIPPAAVAPSLGKAFNPATINAGGISTLTITLSNPDATAATLTAPLTDTLPTGVVIAPTPNAITTCGGAVTAVAGGSTVTLASGTIPANGSCTVTVNVTSPVAGSYFNSLAAGALQTSNGNNAAPAVATLTVIPPASIPPTLGKSFSPATIDAGDVSTLTITLSNPNSTPATLIAPLTDTLPSGVVIASTPNAANTCGGAVTAAAGGSTVTLTGGSIPANGSCTVTVDVTAADEGNYTNSLAAGALQTSNGSNATPAIATLTVNPDNPDNPPDVEPTLGKAFSPATIDAGGVSTLTITLSNPNSTVASLTAPLTDTLPSGVVIASTPTTTCGGTLTVGTSTVTLGKAFSPATINAGGISTLTITLSNPNSTVASLTAPLTDTLPSGVVVAPTPNASTTCGGAVTAAAGGSTVTLASGSSIPANGPCTVTVDVTAPVGNNYINTLAAGALQTSNGNNAAPAVATLTVIAPAGAPSLGKAFSPATINAGGSSTLTITLSNPDATAASLTAPLTDTLPTGVVVAPTPNASTTCGGAVTAAAGGSTVTLASGSSIPANGSCTVTVDVTAPVGGNYINTLAAGALQTSNGNNAAPAIATLTVNPPSAVTLTGGSIPANGSCKVTVLVTAAGEGNYINSLAAEALQTDKGNNATPAVATLTVKLPAIVAPKLSKSFSPATINERGVSTLTITLNNPNSTVANLTAPLTDYLTSGVVVAGNASTTCGGTLTANTGGSTVILTGGSIPANGSCTVKVNVTAKYKGCYINKLPAGALQTDKGSNATPAVATLTVNLAPKLSKSFRPATTKAGLTLTITLKNRNSTVAKLIAPLTDYLPRGVVVSGNASTTCGGTLTANTGGSTVILTGGSIPANGSCTVKVNVSANYKGRYRNKLPVGALRTNKGSNATPAISILSAIQ